MGIVSEIVGSSVEQSIRVLQAACMGIKQLKDFSVGSFFKREACFYIVHDKAAK